jgi:hypothetical protein
MSRAVSLSVHCLLIASAGWGLPGCAQVLGVDDYENGTSVEPPPFDEKPMYLTGAKCENCIAAKCGVEREACAADAVCSHWLESMRNNNFGPIADYNRRSYAPLDWELAPGQDPLATLTVLSRCLSKLNAYQDAGCLDRCEIGRDFSCVRENFQWPLPSSSAVRIRVRLVDADGQGVPRWSARYCGSSTCEPADSEQETDDRGVAQLAANKPRNPNPYVLAVPEPGSYPFLYPLPPGPIRTGLSLTEPAASRSAVDAELRSVGAAFADDAATVWVMPKDCMGNPARHVTVDVFSAAKNSWNRCSELDCPRVYPGLNGDIEVGQSELALGPRALITGVPPFGTWLVVRDTYTGTPVAMQKFDARAGHVHVLTLYPASGPQVQELNRLPK